MIHNLDKVIFVSESFATFLPYKMKEFSFFMSLKNFRKQKSVNNPYNGYILYVVTEVKETDA